MSAWRAWQAVRRCRSEEVDVPKRTNPRFRSLSTSSEGKASVGKLNSRCKRVKLYPDSGSPGAPVADVTPPLHSSIRPRGTHRRALSILAPLSYIGFLVSSLWLFSKIYRRRQASELRSARVDSLARAIRGAKVHRVLTMRDCCTLPCPPQTSQKSNHGSLRTSRAISTSRCCHSTRRRLVPYSWPLCSAARWTTSS